MLLFLIVLQLYQLMDKLIRQEKNETSTLVRLEFDISSVET